MVANRLSRFSQLLQWQLLSIHQLQKSIAKQELVAAIVKPMLKLVQIGVQMFQTDFVIRTDDGALQQAPDAFHAVRMHVAVDPFFRAVVDRAVFGVRVANAFVSRMLVRVDRLCLRLGILMNEGVKLFTVHVANHFETDFPMTFHGSNNGHFVLPVATPDVTALPANVGFVNLNGARERPCLSVRHCRTDSVTEIPRGLVSDANRALNLVRRNALLGLTHDVSRKEPFRERQVRVVKDRVGRDCELVAARITIVFRLLLKARDTLGLAPRAFDAFRPAKVCQIGAALFVIAELRNQLNEVHVGFGVC